MAPDMKCPLVLDFYRRKKFFSYDLSRARSAFFKSYMFDITFNVNKVFLSAACWFKIELVNWWYHKQCRLLLFISIAIFWNRQLTFKRLEQPKYWAREYVALLENNKARKKFYKFDLSSENVFDILDIKWVKTVLRIASKLSPAY